MPAKHADNWEPPHMRKWPHNQPPLYGIMAIYNLEEFQTPHDEEFLVQDACGSEIHLHIRED